MRIERIMWLRAGMRSKYTLGKVFAFSLGLLFILSLLTGGIAAGATPAAPSATATASATSVAPKVLKIGCLVSLTGSYGTWGAAVKNILTMRANELNAQGGMLLRGQRYQITPVFQDDKGTPAGGRTGAEKLVSEDQVKFIIGPCTGSPTLAAHEVTVPAKILETTTGSADAVLSKEKPFVFRTWPCNPMLSPANLTWWKSQYPNEKKFGLMQANDTSGQDNVKVVQQAGPQLGLEFVGAELFETGTMDFYPVIARVLAKNPALILVGGGAGPTAMVVKGLRERGFKGQLMGVSPFDTKQLLSVAGADALEGYYQNQAVVGPGAPPRVMEEAAKWKAVFNTDVPSDVWMMFDMVDLPLKGLALANSADPADVKTALEKMTQFDALNGSAKWGGIARFGINHQLLARLCLMTFKGGKETMVGVIPTSDPQP